MLMFLLVLIYAFKSTSEKQPLSSWLLILWSISFGWLCITMVVSSNKQKSDKNISALYDGYSTFQKHF